MNPITSKTQENSTPNAQQISQPSQGTIETNEGQRSVYLLPSDPLPSSVSSTLSTSASSSAPSSSSSSQIGKDVVQLTTALTSTQPVVSKEIEQTIQTLYRNEVESINVWTKIGVWFSIYLMDETTRFQIDSTFKSIMSFLSKEQAAITNDFVDSCIDELKKQQNSMLQHMSKDFKGPQETKDLALRLAVMRTLGEKRMPGIFEKVIALSKEYAALQVAKQTVGSSKITALSSSIKQDQKDEKKRFQKI